jgi:hypothetical protein
MAAAAIGAMVHVECMSNRTHLEEKEAENPDLEKLGGRSIVRSKTGGPITQVNRLFFFLFSLLRLQWPLLVARDNVSIF